MLERVELLGAREDLIARARLEDLIRERDAEAERQRREMEAARAKERVESLLFEAENVRRAIDIRAYASRVCDIADTDPDVPEAWRKWALAEADRIDTIVSGSLLGAVNVTPEADDRIG